MSDELEEWLLERRDLLNHQYGSDTTGECREKIFAQLELIREILREFS